MRFDLLTERWLPVLLNDGSPDQVGILDALRGATTYRCLVAETPTMTAALHRLLLAFLYRALGTVDKRGWTDLWNAGAFPEDKLTAYAGEPGNRFDLLDEERPFFQCPTLPDPQGLGTADLVSFRAHRSNRTLHDHSVDTVPLTMPPAEAARWLVTTQAYDTAGTKSAHYGEGRSHPKTPPTTNFGVVLVEAENLYRTLLLNLLFYSPDHNLPPGTRPGDRPVWEAEPPVAGGPDTRFPLGWTDVLTWPSRRIRLSAVERDGGLLIDGAWVTAGTGSAAELRETEFMAAFRRPWQTEPGPPAAPVPVTLERLRGVWRFSQELLLSTSARWFEPSRWAAPPEELPAREPERFRPQALEQLASLSRTVVPADTVYTLRVFGQQWIKPGNSGSVGAWWQEAVPVPVALLRAEDQRLGRLIGEAVALADNLGSNLRKLERDFRDDLGEELKREQVKRLEDGGFKYYAELRYWPRLPASFGRYLNQLAMATLDGDSGEQQTTRVRERLWKEAAEEWLRAVQDSADQAARQWLEGESRSGRLLLTASKHHQKYEKARDRLIRVYRSWVAATTLPGEEE